MRKDYCPACGRLVRVREDGKFFKHLDRLATRARGGRQCLNQERELPERLRRFDERGFRL